MKRRVWIYWENLPGKTEPPHITLSRASLYRNAGPGVEVQLVNEENLSQFLPDINSNIHRIVCRENKKVPSLALKTDFIRVFLLEKYGGLYIDSDAVVLRDLNEVFDRIEEKGFVCTRKEARTHNHVPNNFMGSLPGGKIITEYANHMRFELERRSVFEWGEIGAQSVTPLVNGSLDYAYVFPEARIHPITNNEQEILTDTNLEPEEVLPEDALLCMLFHAIFDDDEKGRKTRFTPNGLASMYYGKTLFAKILRRAVDEEAFQSIPGVKNHA